MTVRSMMPAALLLLLTAATALPAQNPNSVPKDPSPWKQHALDRPQPVIVTPGAVMAPVPPPSDAVVLFDGTSLDRWQSSNAAGGPAKWTVTGGYMEVAPGTGGIASKQGFGDMQLHIEWMTPTPPKGESQERGNSGVFMMSTYELQVLDSYQNKTYPDGQAGSIYGEFPPLVNASRPPGTWQSYDVVFHRPHFDAMGKVTAPARMTVFQNGILVQDDQTVIGPTTNSIRTAYTAHADKMPLTLQDHGNRTRFRDIWVRQLPETDGSH